MARDGGARARRRNLQFLPRPSYRRRLRARAKGTNPCASHEAELVAVRSRRRALQTKCQAAKTVDLAAPLRGVRARQASRNHKPGMAHRSRKDRPSAGMDFARPGFAFLALLADVEAATRLDDPDYLDVALSTAAVLPRSPLGDLPAFTPHLALATTPAIRGPIACGSCLLLSRVFSGFRSSVPAGARTVIHTGLRIHPHLCGTTLL